MVGAGGGLGTGRAQYQFRQCAVFLELRMLTKPECLVKAFTDNTFDFATGDLLSDTWKERLVKQMNALRDFTRKQKLGDIAYELLSDNK